MEYTCCDQAEHPEQIVYIGPAQGSYQQKTEWRYVGVGRGEFSLINGGHNASWRCRCCCCFCGPLALVGVIVCILGLLGALLWLLLPILLGPPGYSGPPPIVKYPYKGGMRMHEMYPPFMISATWGLDNCVGVPDPSPEWARQNGCVAVQEDTDGDGIGDGELITRTVPLAGLRVLIAASSSRPGAEDDAQVPLDAVAVKMSWSIEEDSLDWDDFEVTLWNGRKVKPDLVSLAPDNNQNERNTVTVYGQFADDSRGENGDWSTGGPTTPGMATMTVVGDLILTNGTHRFNAKGALFSGGNLIYDKGAVLALALLRDYSPELNPISEGRDNCRQYQGVTHVLQALTQGGTTKDGVNPFNRDQFDLFDVRLQDGTLLRKSAYAGFADIDGDDVTDICLRLSPGEPAMMTELIMNCDMSKPLQRIALPHGNAQGFSPCTDTQPQPITHVRCPESNYCR